MSERKRLVVMISGNGSNLQAILDAITNGVLWAEVAAVISDRPEAYGLERARHAGAPAIAFPKARGIDRQAYDEALAQQVLAYAPDWVVLAGWMRLLSMAFLRHFPGRVVNIHPALPGAFPGTHAIERAWQAAQAGALEHTGVMVHLVPDEGVDNGPVLNVCTVQVLPGETLESLEARIHAVEHRLYVETLQRLVSTQPAGMTT